MNASKKTKAKAPVRKAKAAARKPKAVKQAKPMWQVIGAAVLGGIAGYTLS